MVVVYWLEQGGQAGLKVFLLESLMDVFMQSAPLRRTWSKEHGVSGEWCPHRRGECHMVESFGNVETPHIGSPT